MDNLFVRAFSVAANAVALAKPPAAGTQKQCVDMILDIEPVANVQSIAVEGDPFAGRRFENHDRDQLLGKLPGAVIVGAICEYHWQFIGVMPGTHQVIRRAVFRRSVLLPQENRRPHPC